MLYEDNTMDQYSKTINYTKWAIAHTCLGSLVIIIWAHLYLEESIYPENIKYVSLVIGV